MNCDGTILYIDRYPITRDGISNCLKAHLDTHRVIEAADLDAAMAIIEDNQPVAVILFNIGNASLGYGSSPDFLTRLLAVAGEIPVALLGEDESPEAILTALRAGVRGYLPASLKSSVVAEAVRLVCVGEIYAPLSAFLSGGAFALQGAPSQGRSDGPFTPRQLEILRCLRHGMANKKIAHELNMSEGTVKIHVRKIMQKLQATNRTQIVVRTMSLFHDQRCGS